jgi:hypothetical protein
MMPNQSIQRMSASHLGHSQLVAQRRLALTADARRSAELGLSCGLSQSNFEA